MRKSIIGLTMTILTLMATILPVLAATTPATVTPQANSQATSGLAKSATPVSVKVATQAVSNSPVIS